MRQNSNFLIPWNDPEQPRRAGLGRHPVRAAAVYGSQFSLQHGSGEAGSQIQRASSAPCDRRLPQGVADVFAEGCETQKAEVFLTPRARRQATAAGSTATA
ncbi:unnamed protein product, partial [Polarella glacialis]